MKQTKLKLIINISGILILSTMLAQGQVPFLPEELNKLYDQKEIKSIFDVDARLNPFYLRGDFDGDKKLDYALLIKDHASGKKGILIFHSASKKHYIIGAGKKLSSGQGDDYQWIDTWEVYDKMEVSPGVGESKKIKLKGEAILVQKLEASSGIIYWDGKEYRWYQQGD